MEAPVSEATPSFCLRPVMPQGKEKAQVRSERQNLPPLSSSSQVNGRLINARLSKGTKSASEQKAGGVCGARRRRNLGNCGARTAL